jgi:hypothetical protein
MISYTFKITFEEIDDVSRVIEILSTQSFADFHTAIQGAIGFDGTKPASFYIATDNWRKGNEISNIDRPDAAQMSTSKLKNSINDPHQKFIYVSDFDANWTLFLELTHIQKSNDKLQYPICIKKSGEAPKQYENVNRYVGKTTEFDAIADELIADRMNDDESGLLEGIETDPDIETEEVDEDIDIELDLDGDMDAEAEEESSSEEEV